MIPAGNKYVQYFNFLSDNENINLFKHTMEIEERFKTSKVLSYSDQYADWRRSKEVSKKNLGAHYEVLKEAIALRYEEICDLLKVDKSDDYNLEVHLTAHNDGDYFKKHYDGGTKETNNRVITFVYYFNRSPKKFTGGELVLHGAQPVTVEPANNMIIFFDPMCRHEVLTVHCEESIFENSRFSLNGWILRKE